MKSVTIIFIIQLLIFKTSFSQELTPAISVEKFSNLIFIDNTTKTYSIANNNKNEIQFLFSNLFKLYKKVFSSQDSQRCAFSPSCSEYGITAVKKLGALKGVLSAFDRLTRCNGLSPEKYKLNIDNSLLLDPVD